MELTLPCIPQYFVQEKVSFRFLGSFFQLVDISSGSVVWDKKNPTTAKSDYHLLVGEALSVNEKGPRNRCRREDVRGTA